MKDEEKQSQKKPVPLKGKKMERLMKKRWVYPAIYLAFAALVIASVLWYQNGTKNSKEQTPNSAFDQNGKTIPVSVSKEVFKMPAANPDDVVVQRDFYNPNESLEKKEAALVFYHNTYYQNRGIDLVTRSGKAFDVVAAMSGNVIKAEKDADLGFVVEVAHPDGLVTHYSSLESINVKDGDYIKQGEVIGKAGQNLYDKESKVHAHFEIRKDGFAFDPKSAWEQTAGQIAKQIENASASDQKKEEATNQNQNSNLDKNSESESSKDSEKRSGEETKSPSDSTGEKTHENHN
ncbi:M23 family metallopeptidase [Fictibacillus sp. Mic-4]|uniref:M23 family metallopeptidase n=1 Tax=Fictibacillus TaxID=1329200 RepID=UPI000421D5ED|nr:M23 family metallopeptidase [Fictibacillus gelatini]